MLSDGFKEEIEEFPPPPEPLHSTVDADLPVWGLDHPECSNDRNHKIWHSGDCWAFAIALYDRTGWRLKSLERSSGEVFHVLNEHPSGQLVDVDGFVTPRDLVARSLTELFEDVQDDVLDEKEVRPFWSVHDISRDEVWEIGVDLSGISENTIRDADTYIGKLSS